ncbi:MAG: hypothetical protein KAS12_06040, partial [Candidatus Aenigmarchaeota archaeon]|nr:hypothetical protein [Candidatus Aenigmarchaeota archaeon]
NFWIPTIEDSAQTSLSDQYEYQLIYFIRDMFELSEPNSIKEKINELLNGEVPIFKRIALHTINYHYNDLNELFWTWNDNPLNEVNCKHELHELLKSNCSSFSKKQIDIVLGWIESKKYYISDEFMHDKNYVEKRLAYMKREWLSALLELKDLDVIFSYEKYKKINPTEIDHPGYGVWVDAGWIGTISPIDKSELLNKSNEKIAEYLHNYIDGEGIKKPTSEGLFDTFRTIVFENPEKFANNMTPFLSTPHMYWYALLLGLSDAWRSKKNFTWDLVLKFISDIVGSDDLWNEPSDVGIYNSKISIISQIADLIYEGTKDDNHVFDATLLSQAECILLHLAKNTEFNLTETNNLANSVLNSPKGAIFSAMMTYSLRYARLLKKETSELWAMNIKNDFDMRLDRKTETSLEFSLTLGKYLVNLAYLDKLWVTDNINKIFPKEDNIHWNATFTGYLFSSRVNKELYFLLRKNNHYTKALQSEFNDTHSIEHLIQHICIGYIEDFEKLDDKTSLISILIEKKNISQILIIVNFFWMLRNKLTTKIKLKVKPLWNELYDLALKNEKNPEYQTIISNLSKWLSLIDEIDEQTLTWLKLSVKYIQIDYNASFFVESLLKHVKKTPEYVGELYFEMLNEGIFPEYKKEDIQKIVEILFQQGQKETATRIYNMYKSEGFEFLDEVWEHRDD